MPEPLRILFLEDVATDAELVARALAREGLAFSHRRVASREAFERELDGFAPDVVLSDFSLPGYSGMQAIETVAARAPDTPVIIVTGTIDEETAVACMRAGAADYVLKDRLRRLASAVEGAIDRAREKQRLRQSEEALRRSLADYRSLVDNAVFGILRTDPDGHIDRVNPALVAMLGYDTAEELVAADRGGAVCDDPAERRRLVELLRSQGLHGVEVVWRRKAGDNLTVRLSGREVTDRGGRLEGFEVIAEDVTDRKRLEGQLRQAQKMEAVGQLTGGIAHDFNNILTVIAANAELITAIMPDEGELRAGLDDVRAAAQRGTSMIKKLMSFSRQTVLERRSVALRDLFAEIADLLRRLLPEHITVDIRVGPDIEPVRADPGAVEQMILNLATNANDAMPTGGVFRIDATRTHLDAGYLVTHPWCLPGEYVCISVSDSGVGMDRETVDRIFEPFFTTKPAGVGTGLGMSMVYGLMKQHGGYVNVYSEPTAGTVVKLYFPADTTGAVATPRESLEPLGTATGGTERILVVEDEDAIRRAAKRALERAGYTVHVATDGEEALEILRTQRDRFDLVLSDLVMPKLGGRQLYDALRKEGLTVPFLFTSGYSPQAVHQDAELPEGRLLHKPWTVRELLGRVRHAIKNRKGSKG